MTAKCFDSRIVMNLALATCAISVAAEHAHAGRIVKMQAPFGNKGYTATFLDDPANPFITFCLEKNEYFSHNYNYDTNISDVAANGGLGGPSPDDLSTQVAYLYSQFSKAGAGTLASIGFNLGNVGHRETLQQIVWYFEQEMSLNFSDPNSMQTKLRDLANANANGTLYNVRVMQLFIHDPNDPLIMSYGYTFGDNAQDQLVIIPMPAPVAMAAAGFFGLAVIRRRNR